MLAGVPSRTPSAASRAAAPADRAGRRTGSTSSTRATPSFTASRTACSAGEGVWWTTSRSGIRPSSCHHGAVLLADVLTASTTVAAPRSRTAKPTAIADLLRRAAAAEVEPVTSWLAGEPRQGRLGLGWRTLARLRGEPAPAPSLTVGAVDAALGELAGTSGPGSAPRRDAIVSALLSAATADEQQFLVRLLTGELRQGALEGVVLDAVAVAAGVPAAAVRRAFMLSGQLPPTAATALAGGVGALAA